MDQELWEEAHSLSPMLRKGSGQRKQGAGKQLSSRPKSAPLSRASHSPTSSPLQSSVQSYEQFVRTRTRRASHFSSPSQEWVSSPSVLPFTSSSRDGRMVGRDSDNIRVRDLVSNIQERAEERLRDICQRRLLDERTKLVLRIEICQKTRPTTTLRGSSEKYRQVLESLSDAFLSLELSSHNCVRAGEACESMSGGPVLKVESRTGSVGAFEVLLQHFKTSAIVAHL